MNSQSNRRRHLIGKLRLAIVADNASLTMGGEAARPLHYFLYLQQRGVNVVVVTHERNRDELQALLPAQAERIHYVKDYLIQRWLWRCGRILPAFFQEAVIGTLIHLMTQARQRSLIRHLVAKKKVNLVHEPIPISPKMPSLMFNLGVPVIIGPLNGDMDYPPGFRGREGHVTHALTNALRRLSHFLNKLMPGKRRAGVLLVSNARTAASLPHGCRGRVVELVANATDLTLWTPRDETARHGGPIRFVFSGRLVDFKGVDMLLEAFAKTLAKVPSTLQIIGDGPLLGDLQARAADLEIDQQTTFHGWLTPEHAAARMRESDIFVFPSLRDPGGAVVMEAMCLGLPVIAADWGGPADYVGEEAGLLIKPVSYSQYVSDLAAAMVRLAQSPQLCQAMGKAARHKALAEFDWNQRVDRLIDVYATLL